jgi:hypothetical protein
MPELRQASVAATCGSLVLPVFLVGAESLGVVAGSMLGVADREAAPEAALTRWPRAGQFRSEEDGPEQSPDDMTDEPY